MSIIVVCCLVGAINMALDIMLSIIVVCCLVGAVNLALDMLSIIVVCCLVGAINLALDIVLSIIQSCAVFQGPYNFPEDAVYYSRVLTCRGRTIDADTQHVGQHRLRRAAVSRLRKRQDGRRHDALRQQVGTAHAQLTTSALKQRSIYITARASLATRSLFRPTTTYF